MDEIHRITLSNIALKVILKNQKKLEAAVHVGGYYTGEEMRMIIEYFTSIIEDVQRLLNTGEID